MPTSTVLLLLLLSYCQWCSMQVWYNTETYQKHTGGSTVYVPVNINKVGQHRLCIVEAVLATNHLSDPDSLLVFRPRAGSGAISK